MNINSNLNTSQRTNKRNANMYVYVYIYMLEEIPFYRRLFRESFAYKHKIWNIIYIVFHNIYTFYILYMI